MNRHLSRSYRKKLQRWDDRDASIMTSQSSPNATNQLLSILGSPLRGDANLPKLRIALYSHDTMGLGHKRRNLLIAQTIAQSPLPTSILLITGMGEASNFDIPHGVDYLALPALHKQVDGKYQSRRMYHYKKLLHCDRAQLKLP